MEEVRTLAPSAFATEPYSGMTDKYGYIPTWKRKAERGTRWK